MLQQVAWDLQTTNAAANAAFKTSCSGPTIMQKVSWQSRMNYKECAEAQAALQQTHADINNALQHVAADNSNLCAELAHNNKELQRTQDGLGSVL